ncbi:MAG: CHAD domain-containing protein [Jatrophihabitans sp.]
MTEVKRERELKFEVPQDFRVPDVTNLIEHATVEQSTITLRTTYFDTAELDLLRHAVTLRRREGDADTGWQLKIPADEARDEIRQPLRAAKEPPARLVALLAGIVSPGTLAEVATLETERRLVRVHRDGGLVVEIADDRVVARSGDGREDEWRELEIELGEAGDEKVLSAFAKRLKSSGATTSAHASKLARALAHQPVESTSPAGQLISDYLQPQLRRLVAGDISIRRGQDDIVHKTRVGARRIRSILRVFPEVFDADEFGADVFGQNAARALDAELSWYQDLLGEIRDRQVQRTHFASAVDALPDELVLGPVAGRIEQTLLAEQLIAFHNVSAALATDRYRHLLDTVTAIADGTHVAPGIRRTEVRRLADKATHTASRRLRHAVRGADPDELHRARKAAKRARYAAELASHGGDKKKIKKYKEVQDVLGEHQDAVVSAEVIRRLGTRAGTVRDENGFTYGVLYQRELDAEQRLRAAAAGLRIPT